MAFEYRIFQPVLNESSPSGSLGIGTGDGIIWAGQVGTFPSGPHTSIQMTVLQVAQLYCGQVQRETFDYIEKYMPQWRMNRWRRYYDLRNKIIAEIELNTVEQAEYDCFPDANETHADCDVYVGPCLKWCSDVVVEHNRVHFGMLSSTTIEEVLSIKNSITYPAFLM